MHDQAKRNEKDLGDPVIRVIDEADLPELRRFLAAEIERNKMGEAGSEAFYRWKYLNQPISCSLAAFDGPSIVGFQGMVLRRFHLEGRTQWVMEGTDTFVARKYLRFGVYRSLLMHLAHHATERRIGLIYGRPNLKALPGAIKSGYTDLGPLQMYTRPLTGDFLAGRVTENDALFKTLRLPAKLALQAAALPARLAPLVGIRVERLSRFDDRMDTLWREAASRYDAMVIRDRAYMTWRYFDGPTSYQVFSAVRRSRLLGVAVVGRIPAADDGTQAAELVDLLTIPGDHGHVAYLLIGDIISTLTAQGVDVLRCFLPELLNSPEDPFPAALRLHGFAMRPAEAGHLVIRGIVDNAGGQQLIRRGCWHFRGGDTDYV